MLVKNVNGYMLVIPEKVDVENVKVGEMAPEPFGGMRVVTEIYARKLDIAGKLFVCYCVEFAENSTITMSIKEHELIRTPNLPFNADQLRDYESEMLREVTK